METYKILTEDNLIYPMGMTVMAVSYTHLSACSQLIRKLRKKDWIEQIRNPENNREYQLFLTESGWKIYEEHDRFEQACYKRSFNNLKEFSEEDLKKYISIQKKLNETFAIDVKESKNT